MISLRKQVVLTLLLAMLIAWITVFGLRYHENMRAETGLRDQALQRGAFQALLSLPAGLLDTSVTVDEYFELPPDKSLIAGSSSAQVWSLSDKTLRLRSPWSPHEPLEADFQDGFHDIVLQGEPWRVYAISDAEGRIQVQMAKSLKQLKIEANAQIWGGGLDILTLLFLVLTALIWWVMRRAFKAVDKAQAAILSRSDVDLTPVSMRGMPGELRPFIASINQLLERLGASLERERHMLADAAHELRTPLAAMRAYADLVSQSEEAAVRQQALSKLNDAALRMTRLIEQLLDHARLETPSEGPLASIDLTRLIEMVVRDCELLAARRSQRILMQLQPAWVAGDLDALGVLVRNLLDNALRYTQEGGTIAVTCQVLEDGQVQLRVEDNGPGIAQAEHQRVFDRFYRIPGSSPGGSGIGLSLVARIAAYHQAQIHLGAGWGGEGLGVTIRFPAARPEAS